MILPWITFPNTQPKLFLTGANKHMHVSVNSHPPKMRFLAWLLLGFKEFLGKMWCCWPLHAWGFCPEFLGWCRRIMAATLMKESKKLKKENLVILHEMDIGELSSFTFSWIWDLITHARRIGAGLAGVNCCQERKKWKLARGKRESEREWEEYGDRFCVCIWNRKSVYLKSIIRVQF